MRMAVVAMKAGASSMRTYLPCLLAPILSKGICRESLSPQCITDLWKAPLNPSPSPTGRAIEALAPVPYQYVSGARHLRPVEPEPRFKKHRWNSAPRSGFLKGGLRMRPQVQCHPLGLRSGLPTWAKSRKTPKTLCETGDYQCTSFEPNPIRGRLV